MDKTPIHKLFHKSRIRKGQVQRRRLRPGSQVRVTSTVNRFVSGALGQKPKAVREYLRSNPSDLRPINKLLRAVRRLEVVHMPFEDVRDRLYAKRTATDILHSKKIVALSKGDWAKHGYEVGGCVDYALASVAALKSIGADARFGRFLSHSLIFFDLGGKTYVVNPLISRDVPSYLVSRKPQVLEGERAQAFELSRKTGRLGIGADATDLGIRSLKDFHKYRGPPRWEGLNKP